MAKAEETTDANVPSLKSEGLKVGSAALFGISQ
jgi:hypothetical protein